MLSFRCFLFCCLFAGSVVAQSLTPEQMQADLRVLRSAWDNLHPGLYRYNTPAQIQSWFSEALQKTKRPQSKRAFFLLLSQLNAKLKCGHTFVSYYNQGQETEDSLFSTAFFPLLFRLVDRKFIVTHNLSQEPGISAGSEITAIDGIPTSVIIDSLLTVSRSDGNHGLNKKLDNISLYPQDISLRKHALFDIYFPLFFKRDINKKAFTVTVRGQTKIRQTYSFVALSKEERQKAYDHAYGMLPAQEKSWSVTELDQQTVLFKLGDFAVYNWRFDFKRYLDSVFATFQEKKYRNLLLDIRQNEGGADAAKDEVMSYIVSEPLTCYNLTRRLYRYLRVRDSLLPYLKTWDPSFKRPKPANEYRLTADGYYESTMETAGCDTLVPKQKRFRGTVFLITDATNSSATFILADNFKKERLGTIVGEETGGTQQGINGAQIFFLYLPNSKIEMDIPLVFQAPPSRRPDRGIKPDWVVPTTARDIATGNDPQVKFILEKLIARKGRTR